MLEKKQRRENWEGIEAALRTASPVYVNKDNKTAMRRYYVDGTVAQLSMGPYGNPMPLRLFALLLLEPCVSRDQWQEWEEEQSQRPGYHTGFFEMQKVTYHYFGENTVFEGRETEIYEFFYRKLAPKIGPDVYPHTLLSLGPAIDQISRMQVNPYSQIWRKDQEKFEQLSDVPDEKFNIDPHVAPDDWLYQSHMPYDPLWLARSMCPIEWAYRNPEKFDSAIKPIVEKFRDYYLNTHVSIREVYEKTIEANLVQWAEITCAGGQVSVCIEYERADQLEAMLPLLDPATRFPCKSDDPPNMVRALPLRKGREFRASYVNVMDLWKAGFQVSKQLVLGDRTLFLQFGAPLRRDRMYWPLMVLSCDVTDLEARVKARKSMQDDEIGIKKKVGKVVYLIEPLVGKCRVGAVEKEYAPDGGDIEFYPGWLELQEGENEHIDGILETKDSEQLMVDLLKEYHLIRKEGSLLESATRVGSIDGFYCPASERTLGG